jgi:hypothetical protein
VFVTREPIALLPSEIWSSFAARHWGKC